jgi:drug/metabolite transporter (DMT)-like permease
MSERNGKSTRLVKQRFAILTGIDNETQHIRLLWVRYALPIYVRTQKPHAGWKVQAKEYDIKTFFYCQQADMRQIQWLPPILLLLLGFTWGTGYSIARYVMTHGVNPLGYSFWQSLGPAIIIVILTLSMGLRPSFTPRFCLYYLICGLTGVALPNTNMYFAASHLPAGLLAVIVNTVPIIAYVMAVAARVEAFSWLRFFAVCMALTGLMLIVLPHASLPAYMTPWILYALFTPLCFAFASVYIARTRHAPTATLNLVAGTLIFSTLILLPIVLATKNFYFFHRPISFVDWLVILEMFLSSAGYILFYKLIKMAGPVYYSFVDTIVALTGLVWGYIIFDERLNVWTSLAVFLIIMAIIIISKRRAPVLE